MTASKMKIYISMISLVLLLTSCDHSQTIFLEKADDWDAHGDANWSFSNKELVGKVENGDGFVMTEQSYKNFILALEFKPDSDINSGVFIRCSKEEINPTDCYELNIWDLHPDQDNRTGAIVLRETPLAYVETIDKWNTFKIKAEKNRIQVWVNDTLTADTTNDALANGYIGLQAKGTGEIRFRNVKINTLEAN